MCVRPVGAGYRGRWLQNPFSPAPASLLQDSYDYSREPSPGILNQEILTLLENRAIERVESSEQLAGFYSKYCIIPKKDSGLCPILDLRQLNMFLKVLPFKMLTTQATLVSKEALVSVSLPHASRAALAPFSQGRSPSQADGQIWHPNPATLQLWGWPLLSPSLRSKMRLLGILYAVPGPLPHGPTTVRSGRLSQTGASISSWTQLQVPCSVLNFLQSL